MKVFFGPNVATATTDESIKKMCLFECLPTSPAVCYRKQHNFSVWLCYRCCCWCCCLRNVAGETVSAVAAFAHSTLAVLILILIVWLSFQSEIARAQQTTAWSRLCQQGRGLPLYIPCVSSDTRPALATLRLRGLVNPQMIFYTVCAPRSYQLTLIMILHLCRSKIRDPVVPSQGKSRD